MTFEVHDRVEIDLSGHPEPEFADARLGTVRNASRGQDTVSVELDEPYEGQGVILVRSGQLRPA